MNRGLDSHTRCLKFVVNSTMWRNTFMKKSLSKIWHNLYFLFSVNRFLQAPVLWPFAQHLWPLQIGSVAQVNWQQQSLSQQVQPTLIWVSVPHMRSYPTRVQQGCVRSSYLFANMIFFKCNKVVSTKQKQRQIIRYNSLTWVSISQSKKNYCKTTVQYYYKYCDITLD